MKKTGFMTARLVLVVVLVLALTLPVSALSANVTVTGDKFCQGQCEIRENTTCVPFRAFIDKLSGGEAGIWWNPEEQTAYAYYDGAVISAHVGDDYITANGRCLLTGTKVYIGDGCRIMVAVRPLAKVFGADVTWVEGTYTVKVGRGRGIIESGSSFYDKDDLYWLSRIISAEARGEPFLGKLAVGAVVYNRVESEKYPDTVYGVVFDDRHGIQFTPASTGSVYKTPTDESVAAAKICMEGYRYRDDIIYFCTTEIMTTCWAGRNRPYIETIGGHAFFA